MLDVSFCREFDDYVRMLLIHRSRVKAWRTCLELHLLFSVGILPQLSGKHEGYLPST